MSWKDFYNLVDSGSANLKDWQAAIRSNPNDPAIALKVTLLTLYDEKDLSALENFCQAMISILRDKPGKQRGKP